MANSSPYLTDQAVLGASPEVVGLERQRRLADLLTSQAFQSPQGQMISGQYVKPAITQQIQPLLGALLGSTLNKSLDEKQTQLAAALRGKQAQDIQTYAELQKTDPSAALRFAIGSDNPTLKTLAADELKGMKLGEGETFTRPSLSGGVTEFKGGAKYHPIQSIDLGTKGVMVIDPNTGTRTMMEKGKEAHAGQVIETANGPMLLDTRTGQARPIMSGGQPVAGGKPLPEAATKQVTGATNLKDAINNYKTKLEGFSTVDMANPNARASMGNAYNNMMLQAKEAYNLGVLNGPDYQILQSVVKDPTSAGALFVSKKALNEQASDLAKQADVIISNVYKTHQRQVPANMQPQGNVQVAPAGQAPKVVDFNSLPTGAR